MTHRTIYSLITALLLLMALTLTPACSRDTELPKGAAMYFWRTTLSFDSTELEFLKEQDIRRLYIRFFDVVKTDGGPEPNATLSFPEDVRIPDGVSYVPVVFITPDVLADLDESRNTVGFLAEYIPKRVLRMAESQSLPMPDEIQIDCDWTAGTRQSFFELMKLLDAGADSLGMKTSVTIRLHQLSSKPPTADYGVLMVYNTGDLRHPEKGNPILSRQSIEPYLRYLKGYGLPLVMALPDFSWNVLYAPAGGGGHEYRAILYGCDPGSEPDVFRKTAPDTWTAVGSRQYTSAIGNAVGQVLVTPGMTVRRFTSPPFDELMKIKEALTAERPDIASSVIIYDLNSPNLNTYTPQQYEKIFSR